MALGPTRDLIEHLNEFVTLACQAVDGTVVICDLVLDDPVGLQAVQGLGERPVVDCPAAGDGENVYQLAPPAWPLGESGESLYRQFRLDYARKGVNAVDVGQAQLSSPVHERVSPQ